MNELPPPDEFEQARTRLRRSREQLRLEFGEVARGVEASPLHGVISKGVHLLSAVGPGGAAAGLKIGVGIATLLLGMAVRRRARGTGLLIPLALLAIRYLRRR